MPHWIYFFGTPCTLQTQLRHVKVDRAKLMPRWHMSSCVLSLRWQLSQHLTWYVTSIFILGHMYLEDTSFLVPLMPGWVLLCTASMALSMYSFGRNTCGLVVTFGLKVALETTQTPPVVCIRENLGLLLVSQLTVVSRSPCWTAARSWSFQSAGRSPGSNPSTVDSNSAVAGLEWRQHLCWVLLVGIGSQQPLLIGMLAGAAVGENPLFWFWKKARMKLWWSLFSTSSFNEMLNCC